MVNYLDTALEAAKLAGRYLLNERGKLTEEKISEKAANDFVTKVDIQSEKIISEFILGKYPDHSILSEEAGLTHTDSSFLWIIDPLDGTKNFIHDVPVYGVSIALMQDGEVIMGVINNPASNELFWAEKDKGAFLNGTPIKVSDHTSIDGALLATGFPHRKKEFSVRYIKLFENIFVRSSDIRRMGAATIDLAYVACGRFDGFFELGLNIWDLAAGDIIIKEAGGKIADFWGDNKHLNNGFVLCGNKSILNDLIKSASTYFPPDEMENLKQ
ncbi:MAG: inositol monophosphatase family protein [Calditrichia bacterium]